MSSDRGPCTPSVWRYLDEKGYQLDTLLDHHHHLNNKHPYYIHVPYSRHNQNK